MLLLEICNGTENDNTYGLISADIAAEVLPHGDSVLVFYRTRGALVPLVIPASHF